MALRQMEPVKENIGGYDFYITPFPAFKAANITGELASVLAPLLGVLAPLVDSGGEKSKEGETEGSGSGSLMDIDAGKAAEAMAGCGAISGDKLERLMQKLLLGGHIAVEVSDENGRTEAKRLDLDLANELFCGEVQDMFVLCFHVIRLNFNGFFKRFAARSGKAEEKKTPRKIL